MRDVYIIGVGITRFGRHQDRSIISLTSESLESALEDAGVKKQQIQSVWFGNFSWGVFSGQHSIRGQVALRPLGISGVPIINVENACATGSTAFHGAWKDVALGVADISMCIGSEKLYIDDKAKSFEAIMAGTDVTNAGKMLKIFGETAIEIIPKEYSLERGLDSSKEKSGIMDVYAGWSRLHMQKYGMTQKQLAAVSSKNHYHGTLNPNAQYRKEMTIEEILNDKMISWPITRSMCSPIADGSACAILCSKEYLHKAQNVRPIKVLASVMGSGTDRNIEDDIKDVTYRVASCAYEKASVGPRDLDVLEVHDATAFGEIMATEALGICEPGEGGSLAESGATMLGGRIPVNVSGGLESKGHPIGATGLGQIHELVTQLRGQAGKRQVKGARIGLAENGGGVLGFEPAVVCIHILQSINN